MWKLRTIVTTAALAIALVAGCSQLGLGQGAEDEPPCGFAGSDCEEPRISFQNAEKNREALIEKFLTRLEAGDEEGLEELRVTKDEYQQIIAAGSSEPGERPKRYSPQVQDYFWGQLDFKAGLYADNLIKAYGGVPLTVKGVRYTEPMREYAWYKAYGELRVDAETPEGKYREVKAGYIAEVDGKYKFISFEYDD